jgi:diaminopimelate decarboxylase
MSNFWEGAQRRRATGGPAEDMPALERYEKLLPNNCGVEASGHLTVGGCDAAELAERFGTPLVLLDRATFEARANEYALTLGRDRTFYAGKAFLCTAICELVDSLGLGLDVCSGGELTTAMAARFPPDRIILHGNNKSSAELALARDSNVDRIVVDSFDEIRRIAELKIESKLLVRLTPGVEAHTHEFIQTGGNDSKFGFGLNDSSALEAVRRIMNLPSSRLIGLHAHLGSQISGLGAFDSAVACIADFCAEARAELGFEVNRLNAGGGFAIAHTYDEAAASPAQAAMHIIGSVKREFSQRRLPVPDVELEPGRSIVGPAGITLYRVGTVKKISGIRTYVSVDGGMSDNIRPALYGARYEAFLANRMPEPSDAVVTISGKHCESGDVLIRDVSVPSTIQVGDLLCVPATGDYTYALASTYNRVPRPPVVMVHGGRATEIVRRETYEDLLRLDMRLDGSAVAHSQREVPNK